MSKGKFIFSAFADEIDASFYAQLEALKKLSIGLIELRGIDGKSFVNLTDDEIEIVKQKLEKSGIGISALGTPIGKIDVDGDFEAHKKLLTRIMDIGDMLGCKRLRVFSFYPAQGMTDGAFKQKAFSMMEELLAMAEERALRSATKTKRTYTAARPRES
jgi:sugar phosphate isomerase/epimerase